MLRNKNSKLLLVAPTTSPIVFQADSLVLNIANSGRIFPAIHEFKPDSIMLDYDFLGADTEKVLRRLTGNRFYSKIKIYCYKPTSHTKVDALLKVLGVQYFIYDEDIKLQQQKNAKLKALSKILEARIPRTLTETGLEAAI